MNSSVRHFQWILPLEEARPGRVQPVLVEHLSGLIRLLVSLLADTIIFLNHSLDFVLSDHSLLDHFFTEYVKNVLVFLNERVHDWLSEHRLVNLIMSEASVAHQIYHNIPLPGCSPLCGNVCYQHHSLRIVRIHVENWSIHNTSYVSAVRRGTAVTRIRGEADLIVRHDMYCSLGRVVWKFRHSHGLVHNPLSSEGSVTVK